MYVAPWCINKEKAIYQSLLEDMKEIASHSFKVIFWILKFDVKDSALYWWKI